MSDKIRYIPKPIDTSGIELSEELLALSERLAENVHEVWAKSRMDQGWTYGPERNDVEKKHPCLLPYEKLSEIERNYDKNTALGTLKYIISEGFVIQRG